MNLSRGRRILASLLLCILLLTTACAAKAPSRFDAVQQESTKQKSGQAVSKNATQGSKLNAFFPKSEDGYSRVYTQEKKGFSEANLKKDGKVIAQLAISDTTSTPGTASKYANSTKTIDGYPAVELGKTQTSVLVGKYQVKVISKDPLFNASEREDWIEKFDLDGLSKLK
ncbi:hypothetical protein [Cylindrospermopsis raciborskii]|jgi:hypothetical protein|uniref:hypothetical protein n=1 Tax=Cylindrospermopsis raciborskii TaxID=77022 RepID=UPI000E1F0B5A|nr:hypothetical protein [Cylindrospermopsis raciborskii]UJL33579.1 hypothetical protein C6N34_016270 [Cylindrospermopsis raciborskii Cr2010]UJS06162.1 hypothetical protein L3I90_08095 [Cylindrospermopsis raciborskii KLL07]